MRIVKWMSIVVMTLFFPVGVLAIDLGGTDLESAGTSAGINTSGTEGSLAGIVGTLINVALSVLGVLLLIYFIYAGILWMTAGGDEKQVKKAKDIMQNAVVGLVITLMAQTAVAFIDGNIPGASVIWTQTTDDVIESAGLPGGGLVVEEQIGGIINAVLSVLGVVLLILFIYAGILWMTAQGDGKQVDKAKSIMKNAVIGLVLTLLAYSISSFVIGRLSGERSGGGFDYGDSIIGG